jgi:two-component system, NarL family, response regulator NreC
MNRVEKQKAISILIADDHPIVRQGLKTLLDHAPGFKVVGEASDGVEALRLVERFQPDILILDLMMPGLNGLEAIPSAKELSVRTRIAIFSMYSTPSLVVGALQKGATSYIPKGCGSEVILRALRETMAGRRFLGPPLSEKSIAPLLKAQETPPGSSEHLTPRQREILCLAAEGFTNRQIADRLHLSTRTVEMHRANLMRKLGLHSPSELVRYAVRLGIIPLEE